MMCFVKIVAAIHISMMPPVILITIRMRLKIAGFPDIINVMFSYDIRDIVFLDNNPWPAASRRRIPELIIIYIIEVIIVDHVIRSSNGN